MCWHIFIASSIRVQPHYMNLCEVWMLLNTGIVCIGRRMVEVTDLQIFVTPQVGVSVAVDLIITAPCH